MANVMLNGNGSSVNGRIERLQIVRSDGTIRESRNVNIHNTIVSRGLDNILTVGGFATGSNTNSNTFDITPYNSSLGIRPGLHYDLALWIRMLWFMEIGTDPNSTATEYTMTSLVNPYVNDNGEQSSQSHYIPTSTDLTVRGTTDDSHIAGNVCSTHRITSNSVKVSENNVDITEVGFFVGINKTYTTPFASQSFTRGDMFCRIALGDQHVVLNKGERLVVTYALTEHCGAASHQVVPDINLVDGDGEPIKFTDTSGGSHTIGAISRAWACDGRYSFGCGSDTRYMPGPFHCIHPTKEYGYTPGNIGYGYATAGIITGMYAYASGYGCGTKWWSLLNWDGSCTAQTSPFRVICAETPYTDNSMSYGLYQYNTLDEYLFPGINVRPTSYGSLWGRPSNSANRVNAAGRCNNNTTNPTPYGNYVGYRWDDINELTTIPTIRTYKRGEDNGMEYYREHEYVIPTYMPYWGNDFTATLPSPTGSANIYWLCIRGMIFRLGYYEEAGNLSTFKPCYIRKKYGQVLRVTYREYVKRHDSR